MAAVVIFLISIAYEGLKFWREKLYNDHATENAALCSSIKASRSELTCEANKQKINKKSIRYVIKFDIVVIFNSCLNLTDS